MRIRELIVLLLLVLSTVFFSCIRDKGRDALDANILKTDSADGIPQIEFLRDTHDFGKIVEGGIVSYTFQYRNTGKGGLVITSASASCGCTVPKYSKQPVGPGETGKLEVVFDSQGKQGVQNKTIAIRTNAKKGRNILIISAEVTKEVN